MRKGYICQANHKNKMKVKVLSLLVGLITSLNSLAQKGWSTQLIVQPQSTTIGDYQYADYGNVAYPYPNYVSLKNKFTVSIEAGTIFNYNFSDKTGIGFGLLYSKQGQTYKDYLLKSTTNITFSRRVSLSFLKIPFLLQFNPNPDKMFSFIADAGFYWAILFYYDDHNEVNGDYSYGYSTSYHNLLTQDASGDSYVEASLYQGHYGLATLGYGGTFIDKPYKSDFGGSVAAGLKIKFKDNYSLVTMFSYQKGLVNIKNTNSAYMPDNTNIHRLFWDSSDPNSSIKYYTSAIGFRVGLIVHFH